ncbi:MAG: VWA domain-containing protein [Planctomycetes bacterium]|nr:VWA domain-containing protein [Planctomycetota bacterium]
MSLLTPMMGGILLAATLVPLVALYILRLRRTRKVIGSVIGWKRRTEDLRANAPFQRLRPSWLLALQALLLALLALAAAQPVIRGLGEGASRVALLIDCSASMRTLDCEGRSRLEEARERALARAEVLLGAGLFAFDTPEVMVVAFAGTADVRAPLGRSAARIAQAIESITQTDESTQLGPALELARAHQAGGGDDSASQAIVPIRIEIFSDGKFGDASEVAPRASETVEWVRIGSVETGNAGFSAAGVERSAEDPARVEAFAALRNFGTTVIERAVSLRADGKGIARTPDSVEVPAMVRDKGQTQTGERRITFAPFTAGGQRLVELTTDPGDAFTTDDRAWVALRAARAPTVALVGDDASLDALLSALPLGSLTRLDHAAADAAIAKDAAWTERFDVVVSVGAPPREMSRGRWLHFGPPPALPGLHPLPDPGRDYARTARLDHPTLRQCNLNELVVRKAHALAAERGWTPLIEGGRAPLALAGRTPGGFAILVAFEPGDSNWPFQRSFVNFTAQAVDMLAGLAEVASEESVAPGDMIRVRLPDGVSVVTVTPPGERAVPLTVRSSEAAWGPARRVGAYRVEWTGRDGVGQSRWVTVNQLDPLECDVAAAEAVSLGGAAVRASAGGSGALDAWPWALGLALALLVLEWWIYHRQVSR